MADYTPNRWILDEIAANRKWMVEMMDGMPTECLTSCAKEIESLRAELAKRTDERHALQMQLEEYKEAFEFERKEFHEALDDLAKMKAERDEARQKFCHTFMNPHIEAATRGWDCFKEDGK